MKKKALSLMVLGTVVASTSVQANENWYVAADVFKTELDAELVAESFAGSSKMGSSTGVGIALGTEYQYSNGLSLAWEFEYIHFGTFTKSWMVQNPDFDKVKADIEAQSLNFNVKPKYYFSGSGFYLGAIAGVGVTKTDLKLTAVDLKLTTKSNNPSTGNQTTSDDDSDFGFNYGVEAGYEFTSGVVVSGGYRASSLEIGVEGGGELDLDFDSFYVGVEYHFGP